MPPVNRPTAWLTWCAVLLCLAGSSAHDARAQEPPAEPAAVPAPAVVEPPLQISAGVLRRHVTTLASDEFKGRDTKSGGVDLAAEYLAGEMKTAGLEPAGDAGTYFHRFALGTIASPPGEQTLRVAGHDAALTPADGWMPLDPIQGTWSGRVVWVGRGTATEFGAIAGVPADPLAGAIVLVQAGGALYEPAAPEALRAVATLAGTRGAVAVVAVAGRPTPPGMWSRFALRRGGTRTGTQSEIVARNSTRTPIVWCERRCLEQLLGAEAIQNVLGAALGATVPARAGDPSGPDEREPVALSITGVTTFSDPVPYRNLAGRITGTDAALRDEVVVLSAHYDHIGVDARAGAGDRIYNGADDDASGTAAIMAMGAAFQKHPPKRTVLVLAFTAEELGLLGSKQFVQRPVVPLKQIVSVVNVEMVGRTAAQGPGQIWITGYTRSSFGPIFTLAAAPAGVTAIADPYAMMGFFARSDNYSFAREGIPAHTCSSYDARGGSYYHQVNDHAADCDFDNMATLVHGIYLGARMIASGAATPAWVDGDPLAAKR